jgi:hypothetical protein
LIIECGFIDYQLPSHLTIDHSTWKIRSLCKDKNSYYYILKLYLEVDMRQSSGH